MSSDNVADDQKDAEQSTSSPRTPNNMSPRRTG